MKQFYMSSPEKNFSPKSPENLPSHEKLRKVMARIAQEINLEVKEKHGLKGLVDESLHINPLAFSKEKGGIYDAEDITNDLDTVYALDRHNSGADIPGVQKFYKENNNIDTPEGIVEEHRKKKEMSKSNQAEMVITALMHKILKGRFLVIRSSTFDDYKNGSDNLILDKETGTVICAFDEVLENQSDKERAPVKIEKIKKKALLGGTEAKYGVALKENKLVRDKVRNIPVFYLTLESKDLQKLTDDLYEGKGKPTIREEALFAHLVTSIKEQKSMLESLNLPPVMKKKLGEFEASLKTLESFVVKNKYDIA